MTGPEQIAWAFDRERGLVIHGLRHVIVAPAPGTEWTAHDLGIQWTNRAGDLRFVPWTAIAELIQHRDPGPSAYPADPSAGG